MKKLKRPRRSWVSTSSIPSEERGWRIAGSGLAFCPLAKAGRIKLLAQAGPDSSYTSPAGGDLTAVASGIEAAQKACLVAGSELAPVSAENLDHYFNEKTSGGLLWAKILLPVCSTASKANCFDACQRCH